MTNDYLTPEQSLKIMEKTILQARSRYFYNGIPLILWGCLIALVLATCYFLETESSIQKIWIISYFIGVAGTIFWIIKFKKEGLSTQLDKQIGRLWMGYGILILSVFITTKINHTLAYYVPGTLVATAFTMYVMWFLIDFKPLFYSSIIFLLYAFAFEYFTHFKFGYFVASFVMLAGYVLPGYLMYKRSKALKA